MVDSVVLLMDPQLPRALWPVGRVIKVHQSPDGRVRSADVQIKDKVYTRPVARLIILPAIPDSDEETDSTAGQTEEAEPWASHRNKLLTIWGRQCEKGSVINNDILCVCTRTCSSRAWGLLFWRNAAHSGEVRAYLTFSFALVITCLQREGVVGYPCR